AAVRLCGPYCIRVFGVDTIEDSTVSSAIGTRRSAMAGDKENGAQLSEFMEFVNRRGFLRGAAAAGVASFLAACGVNASSNSQAATDGNYAFGKPLKAAFSNAGLGATWCAQGKETAERWGKWLGI